MGGRFIIGEPIGPIAYFERFAPNLLFNQIGQSGTITLTLGCACFVD